MKSIGYLLFASIFFIACNRETIKIKGKIDNLSDNQMTLTIKGMSGKKEKILNSFTCENGEFNFKLKDIKPPVKLTLHVNDSVESDIWVGEYGVITIEGKCESMFECKVIGSFFCDELKRVLDTYNKMYLKPIKDKIIDLKVFNLRIENSEELTENEQELKCELEKAIKTAKRLRKKSILKTVRKNPNNPVSMGLLYEEFENLTTWQKKEAIKYMSKYFSDTGLNWQMKN